MKPLLHTACAVAALAVVACGDRSAPTTPPASAWKLAQSVDAAGDAAKAAELTAVLCERQPTIDLLFAHDETMAAAAAQTLAAKGRKNTLVIGISGPQTAHTLVHDGVLAAALERSTCADTALDLCLLAVHGVALPPEARDFSSGTRSITREGDGEYHATAAEFLLQVTRRQHPQLLAPDATAKKQRVAVVIRGESDPFLQFVRSDLLAAAERRPQLQLATQSAADRDTEQAKTVTELAAQGMQAIVVLGGASPELATACKAAMQKGVAILALHTGLAADAYTYSVGTSDLELGKAAGAAARRLLPRGGTLVELQAHADSRSARAIHEGLLQGLGQAEAK